MNQTDRIVRFLSDGLSFSEIGRKVGLDRKKVRNCIVRLTREFKEPNDSINTQGFEWWYGEKQND